MADELVEAFSKIHLDDIPPNKSDDSKEHWLKQCPELEALRAVDKKSHKRTDISKYPIPDFQPTRGLSSKSLTARFGSRLAEQKETITEQLGKEIVKEEEIGDNARSEIMHICNLSSEEEFEEIESLFEDFFLVDKKVKKLRKKFKPDVENTGSAPSWNIRTFSKYVTKDELQIFQPVETAEDLPEEVVKRIVDRVVLLTGSVQGFGALEEKSDATGLENLEIAPPLEAVSRIFIDAVVLELCLVNKVKLSMEEQLKSPSYVNNKFDYLLFKDLGYLGVVEAKRVGVSMVKAFVQTSLQLFLIHETMPAAELPLVGIVSNGIDYVFVVLTEQKLLVSEPYHTRTKDQLETVIRVMHNLFNRKFVE